MLNRAREKMLEKEIKGCEIPACIALVISAEELKPRWWQKVPEMLDWCVTLGIREASLFSELAGAETVEDMAKELRDLPAKGIILSKDGVTSFGKGGAVELVITIGRGGKAEVTDAIRSVLEDVRSGLLDPEEIDEDAIESRLKLKQRPDLMIRLGAKELSDFMIWQSAYSELYFIDRSWDQLKKVDFLKAVRDYQRRERRFGR